MEMPVPPPPPASATTEELHEFIADSVSTHETPSNEAVATVLDGQQGSHDSGAPPPPPTTTTETDVATEPPAPRLSDDDTQLQLMGLTAADLDHGTSDPFLSSGVAAPLELEKLEPEILQWMEQCRVANHGLDASEDDALYFLETKYPEQLQGDGMTRVFTWLNRFLPRVAGGHPRFPEELKVTAAEIVTSIDVSNKNNADTLATIATEFGLKSPTTLLFWKRQNDDRVLKELAQGNASTVNELVDPSTESAAHDASEGNEDGVSRRRGVFEHEKEVLEWVLARRGTALTTLDIVNHIVSTYPNFAQGRTTAVLSVWVSRFLKRHLPSESVTHDEVEPDVDASKAPVEESVPSTTNQEDTYQTAPTDSSQVLSKRASEPASTTAADSTTERPRKKRTKRTSPEGYVLHSNEFKLNALKKLDEGKTISEVAEELGLKCTNTLVYWNSIRDKLAVADKKRFRLAGGGRRSTCTFEGELMTWISDRQQKGIGTDVRAVLAYMREFHPSFTEGKKEPTLRKWILRFFQRWRQQSICTGASGDDDAADAAHHDEEDDEELRKSTGILVFRDIARRDPSLFIKRQEELIMTLQSAATGTDTQALDKRQAVDSALHEEKENVNDAEEDEDVACNQKKFFMEREQVQALIHELVTATPETLDVSGAAEGSFDRTSIHAILDRYQEQPHLLDPHLRDLLAPILNEVQAIIRDVYRERCAERAATDDDVGDSASKTFPCQIYRNPKLHRLFQVIYQLCKVRGFKTIVKLMPHEVSDFEPTLLLLQSQDRTDHSTWETRYVLLLWLSMLCLVPFDLQTIDSSSLSSSSTQNSIVASILTLCKEYLADSGATQLAAAVCLSRLLSRPDMEAHHLHRFLSWADAELRRAADLLAASSGSAPMSSADWRAQQFKVTGVMRCLAYLAKYSPRDLHSAASGIYFASVMRLIAQFTEDDSRSGTASSTLHRKLSVKLVQRLGLLYLPPRVQPWRYQRGLRSLELNLQSLGLKPSSLSNAAASTSAQAQRPTRADDDASDPVALEAVLDQLEQIVDALLCGLRDKDTVVRWSAAKGIGRITGRLPFEYADDIVQSVLELFVASEGDSAWHGASLALAELARRGVLLPSRLQDAVDCVARALQYDIRRGTHSIGEHVRDAACYACWSFARAYEPTLLRPHLEQTLAPAMLVTCVFDRELHCRRAASAAFQEHVGRQGRAAFPHGIALLTRADYVSVANRRHAYLAVSPFVASFPEYRDALLEHLVTKKLSHWDASIRELAARAIGRIVVSAPVMHQGGGVCDAVASQHSVLLRRLLRLALPTSSSSLADPSVEVMARHGATLAIAEMTLALLNVPAFIDGDLQREIKNLPIEMDKRRLFRGRGGEMIRCAVCRVVQVIALAEMALSVASVKKLLAFLEECLVHAVPSVRDAAVDAFAGFASRYATVMTARGSAAARQLWQEVVPRFLRRGVLTEQGIQNPNVAARRGYLRALGVAPRVLFELHSDDGDGPTLRDVVHTMLRAAALPMHAAGDEPDAESRVHAIHALVALFSRMRCDGLDGLRGLEGDVVSTLVRCIHTDYGVDERGDVGSWVRKAAMRALERLLLEMPPLGRGREIALVGRRVMTPYGSGTIVGVLPTSLDATELQADGDWEEEKDIDGDGHDSEVGDPVCQVQFDESTTGFAYFIPRGLARLRLGRLRLTETTTTSDQTEALPFEIPPLAQRLEPVQQHTASALVPFARRVPVALIGQIFCALAKQLAEKLDNLRGVAGSILFRLLHSTRPRIDGIPDRFQLEHEPKLFPQTLGDTSAINWSMAHDTFPRVVRMLDIPEYMEAVLSGLVISVGGLTESVVKASRGALLTWYRGHLDAKNLGLLSRTSFHLVTLLTRHQHDDRVTLPLLKTISILLEEGLLSFLLTTTVKDEEDVSVSPAAKEAAAKSFAERLYVAVRDEIQRATSIPKLVAGIAVLVGMLPCDAQEETKVFYALCLFLSHRFPTVRKATAERLYTRLLVHDEIMRGDDTKYDAVVDLLSATAWDGPTSNAKAARNELLGLLGISPPASKN